MPHLQHYEEGRSLANRVLAQIILGFEPYPRLKSNPVILSEVEAGMCFMAGVAHINLGNGIESYQALGRFSVIAKYLRITGVKSDMVGGMTGEATKLLSRLERELGK